MKYADWAEGIARSVLEEPLPRRWAHTQGVAAAARALAPVLGRHTDLLTAAAWLHDIGYAPALADSGFHPLDGARYLRDIQHADSTLYRLVAHHSCAMIEAAERSLAADLIRAAAHRSRCPHHAQTGTEHPAVTPHAAHPSARGRVLAKVGAVTVFC